MSFKELLHQSLQANIDAGHYSHSSHAASEEEVKPKAPPVKQEEKKEAPRPEVKKEEPKPEAPKRSKLDIKGLVESLRPKSDLGSRLEESLNNKFKGKK